VSWGSFRGGGWVSWYGLHYNSSKSFIAIKLAQERCTAENIARNNGTASAKWKSRFCAVFRGIKSDAGGVFTGFGNPEGIESFSPGLADSERPALGIVILYLKSHKRVVV
jgi:hypothetical protein